MINVSDVVHYFNIRVYENPGRNVIEFLSWNNLKWELRLKYDWYFKYRAALLQVKYPKLTVECQWGNVPAKGKSLKQILNNKIRAKKGKITGTRNKINQAKLNWNSLFPIEDDILYKKANEKLKRLEKELVELEADLENLNNT